MKKILYYIDTPHAGGATNQLATLIQFLDKKNYTPLVVCGAYPGLDAWAHRLASESVAVIRLAVSSTRDLRAVGLLKQLIQKEKPDIMHVQLSHSGSCRQAFIAARNSKLPIVATEHDPFSLALYKKFVKKTTLRKTTHTIALSNGNRYFLMREYGIPAEKISVVHNGIDPAEYQGITPADRALFGIPVDHLIVTTIAELHPRKGVKFLLDAVPALIRDFPHVSFLIVGEGEERTALEHLQIPHVYFAGAQADVKGILALSDVYVLPSVREAFGLTILEAFASHAPVIATVNPGPSDIIQPDVNGILVPPGDALALGDAILKLLKSPVNRKELEKEAYRTLTEHFTADRMARETEVLYRKVIPN